MEIRPKIEQVKLCKGNYDIRCKTGVEQNMGVKYVSNIPQVKGREQNFVSSDMF